MCQEYLSELARWARNPAPNTKNRLAVTLVSNDALGPARYAEGLLDLSRFTLKGYQLTSFKGELTMYESQERYRKSVGLGAESFPFDPDKTDKVNMNIQVFGYTNNNISLSSSTKGKAIISDPQCAQGLIFGFAKDGEGDLGVGGTQFFPIDGTPNPFDGGFFELRPYYLISLARVEENIPEPIK